ncbi:hypothetical protein [Hyalangium sp.]|uniref:hypothetical protein n=1 Tax=Hyalangium sp. TaxID=2028555 RepID=UPI002D6ACC05|nr:hypothetical protein [Hyalangium sp.]HYI01907.1 hypothetical protein [Hyalangium sp.]
MEKEREVLRASHERLRLELELLKRRMLVAKAERVDTRQLELEFAQKLRALEQVAGTLGVASGEQSEGDSAKKKKKRKPSGRCDLKSLPLVIARVKYRTVGADGEAALETAMMPKELFFRYSLVRAHPGEESVRRLAITAALRLKGRSV